MWRMIPMPSREFGISRPHNRRYENPTYFWTGYILAHVGFTALAYRLIMRLTRGSYRAS